MKTVEEKWQEFYRERLNPQEMLRIRGGDDPPPGNPDDPIIKGD